jgi:hypothetical protein
MKLRLHWTEQYKTIREYPSFELDSDEYPELELEMLHVHNARNTEERQRALGDLEYKMHHTDNPRGETIFSMVQPLLGDREQAVVHTVGDEDPGFFRVTEEE